MKTLKEGFKKKSRKGIYQRYHLDDERRDRLNMMAPDLYREANRLEERRVYEFEALKVDDKLDVIITEVKIRVRITKQEIFKIGELLFMAQKLCTEKGLKFKEWVEEKFDFSYETAINFIHVYEYCFSYRGLAVEVPATIMYNVSRPSFPEELRDYLFKEGQLEKLSGGDLKRLTSLCKKEGIEAVEKEREEINRMSRANQQIRYNLDMYENLLRILDEYRQKLEKGGLHYTNRLKGFFKENLVGNEIEAQEINLALYNALLQSIKTLQEAYDDCSRRADEILKRLNSLM